MDIVISSPGSPGTNFTNNVKNQIVILFDELEKNSDFESLADFKAHLGQCGLNVDYVRNILPFLQYCGIIQYGGINKFENKKIFTNIGYAYVDILKSIKIAEQQPESNDRKEILKVLERIQETIYFQCLVIMMKSSECNYAIDFFDVLRFVCKYGHIDLTEYFLILFERGKNHSNYLDDMADTVQQYRDGKILIKVKTETNSTGEGKVNTFPYINGNFGKSGVLYKENNKFYLVENRRPEVECAIREVSVCQNLVK